MTSSKSGKLVLAANGLGRPEDIPLRSLDYLRQGDLLIFEEPRAARLALKTAGIHRTFLRFSEHEEAATLSSVEDAFRQGLTVVYMSDQGMPVVADPGQALLQIAQRLGAAIEVVPGPSSITAALAACPFYQGPYLYQGFLARDHEQRRQQLRSAVDRPHATVILETPYRRQALCQACSDVLPADRQVFLAIDISGNQEQYITTRARDLGKRCDGIEGKLNFVLIIAGS